jgi:hypothetical protein
MPLLGVGFMPASAGAADQAEIPVTPNESRMLELLEQLEATLAEVRELLERRQGPSAVGSDKAVRAFADEMFRERDA